MQPKIIKADERASESIANWTMFIDIINNLKTFSFLLLLLLFFARSSNWISLHCIFYMIEDQKSNSILSSLQEYKYMYFFVWKRKKNYYYVYTLTEFVVIFVVVVSCCLFLSLFSCFGFELINLRDYQSIIVMIAEWMKWMSERAVGLITK